MDMNVTYLTWDDIESLLSVVIDELESGSWDPTVVVGITRGGLIPATMISHHLGIPMCSLDVSFRDNIEPWGGQTTSWIPEEIVNDHRILVMDDINDSGKTFNWIKDDWANTVLYSDPIFQKPANWPWSHIKFAALMDNAQSSFKCDFYGRSIDKSIDPSWITFPWESWGKK